jgi:hypothetical protein
MRLADMRVLLTSFVPILGAVVTKRRVWTSGYGPMRKISRISGGLIGARLELALALEPDMAKLDG